LQSRIPILFESCEIGDEFHYVLQCPNFVTERKIIIPKILFNRPSALKLSSLLRPTSIGNLWLDVLNLQKVNLFLSFNTSKYFSNLKFDLNNL
jgi:hypothetical protein